MKYSLIFAVLAIVVIGLVVYGFETGRLVYQTPATTTTTSTSVTAVAPVALATTPAPVQDDSTKQQVADLSTKVDKLTTAVGNLVANQQPAPSAPAAPSAPVVPVQTDLAPPPDISNPGETADRLSTNTDDKLPTQSDTATPQDNHHHKYFTNGVTTGPNGEINPGKWTCGNGELIPSKARLTQRVMHADHRVIWLYVGFTDINDQFHAFPDDKLIEIGTPPEGYPMSANPGPGGYLYYIHGEIRNKTTAEGGDISTVVPTADSAGS